MAINPILILILILMLCCGSFNYDYIYLMQRIPDEVTHEGSKYLMDISGFEECDS